MELSNFGKIESVVIEIKHPKTDEVIKHEGKPFTATLTTLDTPAVKAVQNKYKNVKPAKTVQEEERRVLELFAAATTNLTVFDKGKWQSLDKDQDIIAVFEKHYWIFDQVVEEIGETGNFLTVSDAKTTQKD